MSDPSGQQPGFQQPRYPAHPPYGEQQYGFSRPNLPIPGTLNNAVVLMFIGGGLEALGLVVVLVFGDVNSATILAAALIAGLWFLNATMCRQGKNWARIFGTVLFGINSLLLLVVLTDASKLTGPHNPGAVALLVGSSLVQWLIGLGAVILLWLKTSSAYFKAMSGMR
jgi:hypothetical protein